MERGGSLRNLEGRDSEYRIRVLDCPEESFSMTIGGKIIGL